MKTIIALLFLFVSTASALTDEKIYLKSIEKSQVFLMWLDAHKKQFAECSPKKVDNTIVLCDQTKVDIAEIKKLFKMKPAELIEFIKSKKIKLEIMCKDDRGTIFKNWCSTGANRKFFKEVTSLHGQYIPNENTIALVSDSNFGSLVHEYLHYLQFQNKNEVYGHVYKKERVEIQNDIIKGFDNILADVQVLEKQKNEEAAKPLLKYVTTFSDSMQKFGLYQRIIDERNLFLLFINFSKELGVPSEDVALAKKNIGFLCADEKIKSLLSKDECP